MTATPFSVPGLAICIALLFTVASTCPSTISTSQSEISTPRSLMLGPMKSWLPGVSAPMARVSDSGNALVRTGTSAAGAGAGAGFGRGAWAGSGALVEALLVAPLVEGIGAYGYGPGLLGCLSADLGVSRPKLSMEFPSRGTMRLS